MKRQLIGTILFLLLGLTAYGQRYDQKDFVQFSGVVLTEENNEPIPIPFVNIAIWGTNRGTYTDFDGFFSLVAKKGDTISFSAIGFKSVEFVIPDTLQQDRYTVYQVLSKDTFLLPETVVYPWPSKEHFKIEFLAMDVKDEVQSQVQKNLSSETMKDMITSMETDGRENAARYFREQNKLNYSAGQVRTYNILNPGAWVQFYKAWKRGDFKKKSK